MINIRTVGERPVGHIWLAVTCAFMMLLFVANGIGLMLDPRMITGSPAWLKPAKFSISVVLYSGTLVWILDQVTVWPVFMRWMGNVTAAMLNIEIFVIDLQAWRGTTSHFNFHTNVDSSLFAIMGVSIAILWLASVGIAVGLFQQEFKNRAWAWALRLGLVITVLGSASGGLMTRPMTYQAAGTIGAHTVGAPDGGPGMAGTGWNTTHGDLRVGHFVGLHGMQMMPLFYWLLFRKRRPKVAVIWVVALSYLSAAVLLEWQALRGQAVFQPDSITGDAWLVWLLLGGTAFVLAFLPWRKASQNNTVQSRLIHES